jgi:hypothetical protein
MFQIRNILVRISFLESVPLFNGSEFCSKKFFCLLLLKVHLHHSTQIKSHSEVKNLGILRFRIRNSGKNNSKSNKRKTEKMHKKLTAKYGYMQCCGSGSGIRDPGLGAF